MAKVQQLEINEDTRAFMRLSAAGFKLLDARLEVTEENQGYLGTMQVVKRIVEMQCVCGRKETLIEAVMGSDAERMVMREPWDAALAIENAGAVSVEHLREDGYTEAQIKRISFVYDLEDELKGIHRGR